MIFHDHGEWSGPCSDDKHRMLSVPLRRKYYLPGGKSEVRQEPWEDSMERAIRFAVFVDGVALCACCRRPLAPFAGDVN